MNTKKIKAQDKKHLKELINEEINIHGQNCDLNSIDVSSITEMRFLFSYSQFNGDISMWDTSNVTDMASMFYHSKFNGDINQWNVSNVKNMESMFEDSEFNSDISKWDVRKVTKIDFMLSNEKYDGNLDDWKPYKTNVSFMFINSKITNVPYWFAYENLEERKEVIKAFHLRKKLNNKLHKNLSCNDKNQTFHQPVKAKL